MRHQTTNDSGVDTDRYDHLQRPTTDGLFSGDSGRLVYVDRAGPIRDYSASTLGLNGIERSRLGIAARDGVTWLDDLETTRQTYYDESTLIVTEHDAGPWSVAQYDYTLERAHLTHFELRGDPPRRASLVAVCSFAPDGQERSVGQLHHEDVVEVFHDAEHDYLTASTGLGRVIGRRFEDVATCTEDVLDPATEASGDQLSDTVVVTAPFEDEGDVVGTTLVSLLADHRETERADALAHVRAFADHYQTDRGLREHAAAHEAIDVPDVPHHDALATDIRARSLLTGSSGARIKGPEYDPYHVSSGGYGYAWFRDDAAAAEATLALDDVFGIGADDCHVRTARLYCETQLEDGTWPQRIWAHNGSLAPGWGNDRVSGTGLRYGTDATAAVVAFLARYLRLGSPDPDLAARVETTVADGVDALLGELVDDGLPTPCHSVWEDGIGSFTHATGTILEALSAVGRAPVDEALAARASSHAETVAGALDERWSEDLGAFVRAPGDDRLDAATLALVGAHCEFAALGGDLDDERLERLATHVETTIDGLHREGAGDVRGLARYEGDEWRRGDDGEKLWPVATAMAADAAAALGELQAEHGRDADAIGSGPAGSETGDGETAAPAGEADLDEGEAVDDGDAERDATTETPSEAWFRRSRELLSMLAPDGPLAGATGYLSEQVFRDGRQDSATPFTWAHALRSATVARLCRADALSAGSESVSLSGPSAHETWTTGEKYGIGTACDHTGADPSRVWFTLTEGALTEPRFPRVDLMNLRTVDFLVADPDDGYAARTHNERRTDDDRETIERHTELIGTEAPVYRQTVRETGGDRDWELVVEYVTDPEHDAIVLDVNFTARDGGRYDVHVVADAAPSGFLADTLATRVEHGDGYALAAHDAGNRDDHAIRDSEGEPYHVATGLASRRSFDWATVGAAGSDHLAGLFTEGEATASQAAAGPDHVVLLGQVGSDVGSVADVLALGFAEASDEVAALAEAEGALERGYVEVREDYVAGWAAYLEERPLPDAVAGEPALENQYRAALAVLKAVEDKTFPGAGIASPSVPWGEGVEALVPRDYGYNFTWSRDLYQVVTALLAADDVESVREAVEYLYTHQQRESGFLPQNTYLDGRTRWGGEQLDNIAFPSVMAHQLHERVGLDFSDVAYDYGHVRRSLEYLLRSGPRSGQERWEEEAGYSPSTIAAQVAGLVCGAALSTDVDERADALVYLAHADHWRLAVDEWCGTTEGTDRFDRTPYYVRVSRNGNPDSGVLRELANGGPTLDERGIVDAGFLELVRLGIRDPDEEIVRNSLSVVDDAIRVETPNGPGWYRYNGDGYGELTDPAGAPWSHEYAGVGRLWPIFTGERAEYELLAGEDGTDLEPGDLLATMQRFANSGRMIPEQVWDREEPTDYGWAFGEGTGAATPLAWSMAQFVRLAHAIDAGEPVETPRVIAQRYRGGAPTGPDLSVSVDEGRDELGIEGETDGDEVVVWTPEGTHPVSVVDGAFATEIDRPTAGDRIAIVAATGDRDVTAVGTALETVDLEPAGGHADD